MLVAEIIERTLKYIIVTWGIVCRLDQTSSAVKSRQNINLSWYECFLVNDCLLLLLEGVERLSVTFINIDLDGCKLSITHKETIRSDQYHWLCVFANQKVSNFKHFVEALVILFV